jgi:uncharacterized protein YbbC (DUF1343 family)
MIETEPSLRTGLEVCLADPPATLDGARLGLLANQASLDAAFVPAWERLAQRFSGQLVKLLSPQHGLFTEQQDNMRETAHGRLPGLGLPVYSLYSETRRPTAEMLDGIDVLLVDLQDVGCRVYTFAWTLLYCLEACAERGIRVCVLDRPHPLGQPAVEGPILQPAFRSFVGEAAIPLLHDLTLGELASYLNLTRGIGAALDVVPLAGWDDRPAYRRTGLAWIPPSPNLPRLEGVDWYAGTVLLEGTNLSEGRGTTTPFELIGAPFLDPDALAGRLAEQDLPGVVVRPVRFEPTFSKWQGRSCGGVWLHATDRAAMRPVRTALAILAAAAQLAAGEFAWKEPPYEYEETLAPIDILSGSAALREAIDIGDDPTGMAEPTPAELARWREETAPHRRYGRDAARAGTA